MKRGILLLLAASLPLLIACGKKAESPLPLSQPESPSKVEIVCSYAPSQSAVVGQIAAAAGGSAAATAAIAQALGLTVVVHSSGAYILTGAGGYIAGTLGPAIAGPVVVGVGVAVGGTAGVVELLCAPRNHPEFVAKVESAAEEFLARSKAVANEKTTSLSAFAAEQRASVVKAGNEAFDYAYRKSVEVSEALGK